MRLITHRSAELTTCLKLFSSKPILRTNRWRKSFLFSHNVKKNIPKLHYTEKTECSVKCFALFHVPSHVHVIHSPSLALGRPSDKAPVHADGLTHELLAVQSLHGSLRFFIRFILHQCVALLETTKYKLIQNQNKSTSVINRSSRTDFSEMIPRVNPLTIQRWVMK